MSVFYIIQYGDGEPAQTCLMTEQQIITEAESLLGEGLVLEIYRIFDQDESAYYDFCREVMIGIYRSRGVQTEIYSTSSERDSYLLSGNSDNKCDTHG